MVQHGSRHDGGRGADGENTGSGGGESSHRRPVTLVVGRHLLTVNAVDGSEIEPCPPTELPGEPRRLTLRERAVYARHAASADGSGASSASSPAPGPAPGSGPAAPGGHAIPMLERDEERGRLAGALSRGCSIRLTGLPGSGRTTLLNAVAAEVTDLAPDGVIRLSGYRRTAADLLQELFSSVHEASRHRPGEDEMRRALRSVGAVVIIDDLAFGDEALGQLLDATPECAYLLAATPDVPPPAGDVHVEEVRLTGLSRTACLELLEHAVRRPLSDEEADAAQDMWFASEESSGGLPVRFVQAGALLRYGGRAGELSGSRGSAMSARVAERLSSSARDTLRFALALGGEVPHHSQLPALVGDRQADEAEGELARAGLVTVAGGHYRLAEGVAEALAEAGFADGTHGRALMAAHHYGWWVDHPSVSSTRVAAEADAVLAAVQGAQAGGQASAAVLLARSAAPVLAASMRWSVWDKVLRGGLEAARTAGEVAQEAYFHHELGVLALCGGQLQRATAELEASIGLRGALADQQGTFAGRRALALATDLIVAQNPAAAVRPDVPPVQSDVPTAPAAPEAPEPVAPVPAAAVPGDEGAVADEGEYAAQAETQHAETQQVAYAPADTPPSLVATLRGHRRGEQREGEGDSRTVAASVSNSRAEVVGWPGDINPTIVHPAHRSVAYGARRNLAAAGAGAVLIAVLATIVGLGRMPDDGTGPLDRGTPGSTSQREDRQELNADDPDSRSPRTGESSKSSSPSESGKSPDASDSASEESPSESSSAPDEDPSSSEPGDSGGSGGSPTGSPGTNGGTDSGGTDDGGTDDGGTDTGGTDDGGTDTGGTDDGGTDTGGTDDGGTDTGGTDDGGTDTGGTDDGGTDTGGTDTGGTATSGGTTGGASGGADNGGNDGGGSDSGGTTGTVLGAMGIDSSPGAGTFVA